MYTIYVGFTSGNTFGRDEEVYEDEFFTTDNKDLANEMARLLDTAYTHYHKRYSAKNKAQEKIDLDILEGIYLKFDEAGVTTRYKYSNGKWSDRMLPATGYFDQFEYIEVRRTEPELFSTRNN